MSEGQSAKDARATKAASPSARSGARAPVPASADLATPPAALGSRDGAPEPGSPAPDDDFDPRIGTLLGDHYRILERIGSGGMGTVYLVVHVHRKKKFAAKILNADTARRPDALARFHKEAVSASKLDHENIVDIVNFGVSEDGTVYLVMGVPPRRAAEPDPSARQIGTVTRTASSMASGPLARAPRTAPGSSTATSSPKTSSWRAARAEATSSRSSTSASPRSRRTPWPSDA